MPFFFDALIRLTVILFFTSYDKKLLTLLLLSGMLNNLIKLFLRGVFSSLFVKYSLEYPNSLINRNLFNFATLISVWLSFLIGIPFVCIYYMAFTNYTLIEILFLLPIFLISTSASLWALRYKGTGRLMYYNILENSFFSICFFSMCMMNQYFSFVTNFFFILSSAFVLLFISYKKISVHSYYIKRTLIIGYRKNVDVILRRGLRFLFFRGRGLALPLFLATEYLPFVLLIERLLQFSSSLTGPIDNYFHRIMHQNALTWKNVQRIITLKLVVALIVQCITVITIIWYFPDESSTLDKESLVYLSVALICGVCIPVETFLALYLEANGRSLITIKIYSFTGSLSLMSFIIFGSDLMSFSYAILSFVLLTIFLQLLYNWWKHII